MDQPTYNVVWVTNTGQQCQERMDKEAARALYTQLTRQNYDIWLKEVRGEAWLDLYSVQNRYSIHWLQAGEYLAQTGLGEETARGLYDDLAGQGIEAVLFRQRTELALIQATTKA